MITEEARQKRKFITLMEKCMGASMWSCLLCLAFSFLCVVAWIGDLAWQFAGVLGLALVLLGLSALSYGAVWVFGYITVHAERIE